MAQLRPAASRLRRVLPSRDAEAADDITVQAMAAAVRSVRHFDPSRGTFTSWMYGLTRRLLQGQLRRWRRRAIPLDQLSGVEAVSPPEDRTSHLDAQQKVRLLAASLSAAEMEVLVLHLVHGFTVPELARLLKQSNAPSTRYSIAPDVRREKGWPKMPEHQEDIELAALLKDAQPALESPLQPRAVATMTAAASSSHGRWFAPRRIALVGALVVPLLCGAWLVTGRGPESALAQAAEAMAQGQEHTLHRSHLRRGDVRAIEGWFEGRTKMRMRTEGASEEIQDGDLRVRIRLDETPVVVHYSRLDSRDAEHTDAEMFAGPDMLQEALTKGGHLDEHGQGGDAPGRPRRLAAGGRLRGGALADHGGGEDLSAH